MRKRTLFVIGGVVTAGCVALGGSALASDDDGDAHVTGHQADRAIAAALRATGGGHANSVERDSENGATWEVEVTTPDGVTSDVRLGQHYQLVVIETDNEH